MKLRRIANIKLDTEKFPPKLIIHEKYEKHVKWFLRIFTLIGIASSVIAFPVWYLSLGFALLLFFVEQFFEKSVFQYTVMYIQPLPNFTYQPEEWKGMAFIILESSNPKIINSVGFVFETIDYAKKIFELIYSWNNNSYVDNSNNLSLSFILEEDEHYSTYLFPSLNKNKIDDYFKNIKEELKFEKFGKKQQELVMQMTLCKLFPYTQSSYLTKFIEHQDLNKPFWLKAFLMDENEKPIPINEIEPILKYNYKCKKRTELDLNEFEYTHGKFVMKIK